MSTRTKSQVADLKKLVYRGHNVKFGPVELYVGEADGEMWATNRYWAVRAVRIAPLLEEYNLSAGEVGAYDVNGKVSRAARGVPTMGAYIRDVLRDFTVPGTRQTIAGQEAYVLDGQGSPMAVWQLATGQTVGLLASEAEWLGSQDGAPVPEGHHISGVRVLFRVSASGTVSAAFIADVVRVIEPARYGKDAGEGTGGVTYVPEVSEPAAPVVLAVAMAFKYGDS
jgi:hypothetical protein